ncbi:MAG TPA: 3-deoxy-manno-octulosonate cytidylyltransferase [Deltaproteobacteria bacterium]|nr:3-deoxy-manno-octulosonate cytidylyltransferase [Deltaproteobacteria bacterium]
MKVAAVIPARYASTRLEGKPLADICGTPMIRMVYERACRAALVDTVVVATDDERILSVVRGFGGRAVMTSRSHRSGTERVAEAARDLDAPIVVNLQGDEPLIEPSMVDEVVRPLVDEPGLAMATLKTPITDEDELFDPHVVKVVTDRAGRALYFSRSPIPHRRGGAARAFKHIGIYAFRRDFLFTFSALPPSPLERSEELEQLRALENGYSIKVVETDRSPVAVDTPEDLDRVRGIVRRGT